LDGERPGEKIRLVRMMTDNDEGSMWRYHPGAAAPHHYNNRDFAILYRTNAQSRALRKPARMAIPYTMYAASASMPVRKKDVVAYLRIIVTLATKNR